jgi:plastocyanin
MKKIKKIIPILVFITLVITFYQCNKSDDNTSPDNSSPGSNEVWMQNMAFNPATITVSVNSTVKWTNKDGTTHTVTSTNGLFDSGNISSGGTFSHHFTSAGTFSYKCTIHSNMSGTIIVQ